MNPNEVTNGPIVGTKSTTTVDVKPHTKRITEGMAASKQQPMLGQEITELSVQRQIGIEVTANHLVCPQLGLSDSVPLNPLVDHG